MAWGRVVAGYPDAVPDRPAERIPPRPARRPRPRSRTPRRTTRPATALLLAALVVTLLVGGCSSSQPATLDAPLPASDVPLLAATASAEPTLAAPDDRFAAVGRLADDFPGDLVTLPPDAEILVSSAQPDGAFLQISLNLRTAVPADELVGALTSSMTAAGFTESPVATPPVGVAAESTFARESGEVVTVAVLDRAGVRTLTLGGRVATS